MATNWVSPNRVLVGACALTVAVIGARHGLARVDAQASLQTITCEPGFAEVDAIAAVFAPLGSLKTVPNPVFPPINPATNAFDELGVPQDLTRADRLRVDDNLTPYIANVQAAVQLGKALFWDMQAGSDNQTSCGSCHFHAGADRRHVNQLSPGFNRGFADGPAANFGPNHTLTAMDFPFTDAAGDRTDNVVGSQGGRMGTYGGLDRKGNEIVTPVPDPVFSIGGQNLRQVGGVQAPSVINAVFNHRNFWDGRGQPDFNGVNPWGTRDGSARVWTLDVRGNPIQTDIRITDAALAAQSTGPPLNDIEMSASGRTFPELGRKLLARKPLGLQKVDPTDSVLGALADPTTGLTTTYATLIRTAFRQPWWNSQKSVSVGGKSYTMSEANFSLFWGLSIMLYQATLVSDDTPMDRYLASRVFDITTGALVSHDPSLLQPVVDRLLAEGLPVTVDSILEGLTIFERPMAPQTFAGGGVPAGFGAACSACHVGAELTSASVRNLTGHPPEAGDDALRNAGFDLRMERMFMNLPPVPEGSDQVTYDPNTYEVKVTRMNGVPVAPILAPVATYDTGWYNIGVRRTLEGAGLAANDAFAKALSWTRFFKASPNPGMIKVPGGGLGCATSPPAAPPTSVFAGEVLDQVTGVPVLSGALKAGEADAIDGSFKTPSLRNVELTGPYFHNGGKATLQQVVEFYDDGADFGRATNPTRAPLIMPLNLTPAQQDGLIAFLAALTDERVRYRRAPFDHPAIVIPNGATAAGADILETIAAVGRDGAAAPLQRFLNLSLVGGTTPPPPPPAPVPVVVDDAYSTPQDTALVMTPLVNDRMSDGSAVPAGAVLEIVSQPALGSLQTGANNTLVFTPSASGTTSMQYRVAVNGQVSQAATVAITVTPVVTPPAGTIAISQAAYRQRQGRWTASGTSSGLVGQVLQVRYVPPGAQDGPVLASATVTATGAWSIDVRSTGVVPDIGSSIKVVSPTGIVQFAAVTIIN